ncbi:hypothetical protein CRM90_04830 [Mycobacterium sp. ENV421]|nr:hypothetical protein CRM90_04830 [Mycobacterium sp. ENV421]
MLTAFLRGGGNPGVVVKREKPQLWLLKFDVHSQGPLDVQLDISVRFLSLMRSPSVSDGLMRGTPTMWPLRISSMDMA